MVRPKSRPRSQCAHSGSSTESSESERSSNSRTNVLPNTHRNNSHTGNNPRGVKKKHVLQDIIYFRKTTHLVIPKMAFGRLVREVVGQMVKRQTVLRIQVTALEALQEAAEMYLTQFFEDAVQLSYHAKRVTLMRNDMILMRRLRGPVDIGNH